MTAQQENAPRVCSPERTSQTDTAAVAEQALAYAARGWPVFPCHHVKGGVCTCGKKGCTSAGKHPRTRNGLKNATTDSDMIRKWWRRWPDANIGVGTGPASGFFVLDVDLDKGGNDSLAKLEEEHGKLPDTAEATTGGGGRHVLFSYPQTRVRNTTGLRRGLDIRGDGGYIIAAPSNHISGGTYQWVKAPGNNGAIMPAPDWLLKLLAAPKARAGTDDTVREGRRNDTLTRKAGSLRRNGASESEILTELQGENKKRCSPQLDDDEVRKIAKSIAQYASEPRPVDINALPDAESVFDHDCIAPLASLPVAEFVKMKKALKKKFGNGLNLNDLDAAVKEERERSAESSPFFDGKAFIPLRLAKRLQEDATFAFGFDPKTGDGRLMRYDAGVWRPDAGRVEIDAKKLLGEACRRNRLEETIHVLGLDVTRRPWSQWNSWEYHSPLINCTSGMLDVMSGEMKPHSPEYYSMFQIPHVWDPRATDDRLMKCLARLLPDDDGQTLNGLFEMLGYFLVPCQAAKRFFVLVGPGDCGKNVIQNLARNLVGPDNCAQTSWQALCENRFATARLEGKLLNAPDELSGKQIREVEHLKMLTGGNTTFDVERKGVDAYEAPLTSRSLFTCNELPTGAGEDDDAYYNRLVPIPLTKSIPREGQDPWYRDEMPKDGRVLAALFVLAVEGLRRLIRRKWMFELSEACARAVGAYRVENDPIGAFVKSRCRMLPDAKVPKAELGDAFEAFCGDTDRAFATRRKLYDRLRSMGVEEFTTNGKEWLRGIGLNG